MGSKSESRRINLYINGKEVKNNIKSIRNEYFKLINEQSRMTRGSKEYYDAAKQIKKLKGMMNEHNKVLGRVQSSWQKFKNIASGFLPAMGAAAIIGTLKSIGSEFLRLTTDIQSTHNKATIVLGGSYAYVTRKAAELGKRVGLTRNEFVKATANTADLLVPLDFNRKRAAELATELTELSGALDEWSGGTYGAKQVSEDLTKGMLGEMEVLKKYGIAIRKDSDEFKTLVEQKMNDEGATKAQAEALATYELILSKTKDAQTSFNTEGNKLLRTQKSISTWWRQMKENVVQYFSEDAVDKIEKERIKVNSLVIALTNTNTAAKRRNDIYDELKRINPDIVEGIKQENINVEKLRTNLQQYNSEMIKKIAIQESEEILQEKREEYGLKIGDRIRAENDLSTELLKLQGKVARHDKLRADKINKILLSKGDILDKEKEIRTIVEEFNKEQGSNLVIVTLAYNAAYRAKNLKEDELELQKELNEALEEYTAIYNRIFDSPDGDGDEDEDEDEDVTKPTAEYNERDTLHLEKLESLAADEVAIHSQKLDSIELRESEFVSAIIEKHQWLDKKKRRIIRFYANEAMKLGDAVINFNIAAMNKELNAAGDNEAARDRIRREYARKNQNIAAMQARISGALAIMNIWAGQISMNPLIDTIIKSVLTAAQIIQTESQVAVIKSQSFEKGGYTDGATHYIAGEAGQEYIAPNWQLEHPVYGPLIEDLNQARLTDPSNLPSNITNNYGINDSKTIIALLEEQRNQNEELLAYLSDPNNRRAYFSRDELTRFDDEVAELKSLADIS